MTHQDIQLILQEGEGYKIEFKENTSGLDREIVAFAKEQQRFVPWSVYTVVLFKDKGGSDVIDRKEITGSLFEIVDQVMDFVRLYSKVAYRFTGKPQREEIFEYPLEAVREAVINSVMHKDYFEHGHNNILKFFPDRIQIENIWQRPRNFVIGRTVFRRNQLIADLFSRIHFGEKLGSGMQRMKEFCKVENAPYPKVEYTDTHFYIIFKQSDEYLKKAGEEAVKRTGAKLEKGVEKGVGKGVGKGVENLSANERTIYDLIKRAPNISKSNIATQGELSKKAVDYNIEKLKNKGILRRIGPDKGGYWEVIG